MKSLRHFLGIFNYGITWLGLIRVACGVGCVFGSIFLYKSSEPLFLKIFGILCMLFGAYFSIGIGFLNLKEGYNHLKYRDEERLLYRVSRSDNKDE